MPTRDIFKSGEHISGDGVTLAVVAVEDEVPTVEVIETTEHWERNNLRVGTRIVLEQKDDKWMFNDEHLPVKDRFPWMIITIQPDGSKTMCHYR